MKQQFCRNGLNHGLLIILVDLEIYCDLVVLRPATQRVFSILSFVQWPINLAGPKRDRTGILISDNPV